MKIIFLIICILVSVFCSVNAQDSTHLNFYNGDTLLYFQRVFEANKSNYTNKPLNVLLGKLDMRPLFYHEAINLRSVNFTTGINLFFIEQNKYDSLIFNNRQPHLYRLYIKFLNPAPEDSVRKLISIEHFNWGRYSKRYYNTFIVKDFKLLKL